MRRALVVAAAVALACSAYAVGATQGNRPAKAAQRQADTDLWQVYTDVFSKARYIDLTHTVHPTSRGVEGLRLLEVRAGGRSGDGPAVHVRQGRVRGDRVHASRPISSAPSSTRPRTGRRSTRRSTSCRPTYALRPLVVISIVSQVKKQADYKLTVADVRAWEKNTAASPPGSVVMVRSDWSKKWTDDPEKAKALAADPKFPGVSLRARVPAPRRHILFHGHEPLDTDNSPDLAGESWLMHHGYTQAEGVDNLDDVPADRLPAVDRLPEVQGRSRRLRALRGDLPAGTKHGAKISSKDAPLAAQVHGRCTGTSRRATGCAG